MNERERAERILANLAGVGEDLLALVDDVGAGLDYRDQAKLEATTRFLGGYRQKLEQFQALSEEVAALIRQRFGIAKEEAPGNTSGKLTRVAAGTQPFGPAHSLAENFTFTRPAAFSLSNLTVKDVPTWSDLYAAVCVHLAQRDQAKWRQLPDVPEFSSPHGRHMFGCDARAFKRSRLIAQGVYADTNMSANYTRDMLKKVLAYFGVDPGELKVYLRKESQAGEVA